MKIKHPLKEYAPDTNQGRLFLKIAAVSVAMAATGHLVIGAGFAPVIFCVASVMLSLMPLAYLGPLNIAALLIALVGFRYVGFPLFAKLAVGQPLDTYLLDPAGSFGVVLVGVFGYASALLFSLRLPLGRPLLAPVSSPAVLGRISVLAAAIGIFANMAVALRAGEVYTGVTVASFFTSFLHLALIAGIGRAVILSGHRRSVDPWVLFLLVAELSFAMVRNSRMALFETLLCFVVTVSAFEYRIRWRQFIMVVVFIGVMATFITPVFLYVRGFRGDLSWTARISATMDAMENWPEAFSYYQSHRSLQDRSGWFLNYYASPQNTFERMSHINHVDVLKAGFDGRGRVGWEDIYLAAQRVPPRLLSPEKIRGYSRASELYPMLGIPAGPYATAALIGNGYAAFGWAGCFFYPAVFGMVWLLVTRKISGFILYGNIWAIYLLLRVHNQFVEGGVDSYFVHIFRTLPQDFILLWLVELLGTGRFPFRNRAFKTYEN